LSRSAVVALSTTAALLGACGKPLDAAECDRLLDRYTERLVLQEQPDSTPEELAHRMRQARELAHRDDVFEFDRCASLVSRRQFECAMSAPTVDDFERCLIL
jgi:hypothetical protein